MPELLAHLALACEQRARLQADPEQTAYRVFHGHGEGAPGLLIDRLGDCLVVTHREEHADRLDDILDLLAQHGLPMECVVARTRRGGQQSVVVRGAAPAEPTVVLDGGLRFEVEPLSARNAGLYLDARPARAWLREHSDGRRVLNLFAYTGSLGLAAAAGGARSVMHVEMQKRALVRLKRNHLLNELPIDERDIVKSDLYPHLRRLARRGTTFDGVILDPPPQVPRRGQAPVGQDYPRLVPLAVDVLAPGGWLLCFFSSYERTRQAYEAEVLAASPCPLEVIGRGQSGGDFPEADPEAKLRFTAFERPADASLGGR